MRLRALNAFRMADKFGFRLGLILTLALAPVGILALLRSAGIDNEIRSRTEVALVSETLHAATPVFDQLAQAKGLVEGLAVATGLRGEEVCARLLPGVEQSVRAVSNAAIYDADGRLVCGSPGSPELILPNELVQTVLIDGKEAALITVPIFKGLAGRNVADTARRDSAPHPDRRAVVAVALNTDDPALLPSRAIAGTALILLDTDGHILSSNIALSEIDAILPQGRDLRALGTQREGSFIAPSVAGAKRIYSLNSLIPGRVLALGSWPDKRNRIEMINAHSPLIVPAATWAACLVAAWIAAEFMVTRHMRRLRGAISAFSQGDRRIDGLDLTYAPREIRQAAEAFGQMTETILKDEAELEDAVRQREALLRELHHRVKNNLQLMASIMNLQIRRTRSDEARKIMLRLQDRMLSLATVHNGLFHTASLTELRADHLFAGIVDQIIVANAGLGLSPEIEVELAPLTMSPEQIVPLALLLTEALGRAMRSCASTFNAPVVRIRVILERERDDQVRMSVCNEILDEIAETLEAEDIALSNQLMQAFAFQLAGTLRRERREAYEIQSISFQLATAASGYR
jgi:two-component sensor histidine kinase